MVGTSFLMASLLAAIATAIERDRIRRGDPQSTWPGWSAEAFHEWGLFLSCAAPSIVMVCTEWWSFEMLVIMSGWLPNAQTAVAVMGLCLNLSGAIWMVVSGVGMACSATVAAALGAGDWKAAQRTTLVSVVVGLALELGAAAIVLLARRQVGAAFTDAQAVITCVASLMPVFAASLPGDGINCVLQGFLRGECKPMLSWENLSCPVTSLFFNSDMF